MKTVAIDCEFVPFDMTPKGLVSIGVTDGESSYYAVNGHMDPRLVCARPWMVDNVWKHIPNKGWGDLDYSHPDVKGYARIAEDLSGFFHDLCPSGDARQDIRLIAWCGAQDILRLHSLWDNDWEVIPKWIPRWLDDIERLMRDSHLEEKDLPDQPPDVHHALHDAYYDLLIWNILSGSLKNPFKNNPR